MANAKATQTTGMINITEVRKRRLENGWGKSSENAEKQTFLYGLGGSVVEL